MKVKFANGTSINYLNALETEEFWNGSQRRTLTFTCDAEEIGLDQLNSILNSQSNLENIELTNEENGITNFYDGYTIKISVGVDKEKIVEETPVAPAQYADRIVFKLGKPTFIEAQLAKLGIG